jgi:hypothetical protein
MSLRRLLPVAATAAIAVVLLLGRAVAGTQDAAVGDLPELVAAAERICEVEVLEAVPARLDDGTIETRYSLRTLTPIKGVAASVQEVRMPGGEVAGRGLVVPGVPRFAPGERIVLFLTGATEGKAWRLPVGLERGTMRVLPGAQPRVLVQRSHEAAPEAVDRDAFVAEVLDEVARQRR